MTREELFSVFPRPWRLDPERPGVVLDARGREAVTVDEFGQYDDADAFALAELIVDLVNEAEV